MTTRMIATGSCFGALVVVMTLPPAIAAEQKAHQHGQASLRVIVDGQSLQLALESPLENFIGFERAPRNDKERAVVQAMARELRAAEKHFVPSIKAGCKPTGVKLESEVIEPALLAEAPGALPAEKAAAKGAAKGGGGHADLDASFVFRCERPEELRDIQVNLVDTFRRLTRIDAQVAGPKSQAGARLTATSRKLAW